MVNRCYLFGKEEETIDHILVHCGLISSIWNLLFCLFGVFWVLPFTSKEVLFRWHGSFVGWKRLKVWRAYASMSFLVGVVGKE